ncbi:hypothetical protein V2W45_1523828 [Cenococcum geophilum]
MVHTTFPRDLPVPEDDGACAHLRLTILFYYPCTGAPGEGIPDSWNATPCVRGCAPQACGFRDTTERLYKPGVNSLKQKNGYTFHIIFSDEKLKFVEALNLPTFEWDNRQLVKRLTLAIENAHVIKFWYPVFPPDKNAKSGSVVGE